MTKHSIVGRYLVALSASILVSAPALAQTSGTQMTSGAQGDGGRQTASTGSQGLPPVVTRFTTNQRFGRDGMGGATTTLGAGLGIGKRFGLAPVFGPVGRNELPETRSDSMVKEAGGRAWLGFGNEGVDGPPPFMGYTPEHRIERTFTGVRAEGLTTGHASLLPPASGGDEKVAPEPFTMSGSPYPARAVPHGAINSPTGFDFP